MLDNTTMIYFSDVGDKHHASNREWPYIVLGNMGGKPTDEWSIHGYENSLDLCLPPLSLLVFRHDPKRTLASAESTGSDLA